MNAELTAYLARLAHPARRAYASAYASHILTGAAAPKRPKGLDADTAEKIQRKVERYAKAAPSTPATPSLPDGAPTLQDMAETLRAYAAECGNAELLGLVDAFTSPAEVDAGECLERLSDYYKHESTPAFVDTAECDALDITDLEPSLSRALALKLARWNNGGKVYERRNGRRYLARHIKRIDVNDATVQALPNYCDLVSTLKERGIAAA